MTSQATRDHGGGLDAAIARFGGARAEWLDLSTGINPRPYPIPEIPEYAWASLPDTSAQAELETAARRFWNVPDDLDILAAPGASALIAAIPTSFSCGGFDIPGPTYNEHAGAFRDQGLGPSNGQAAAFVAVHPNNPDGRLWASKDLPGDRPVTVIDESFCDTQPRLSHVGKAQSGRTLILKSFGKFWGLAGLRLGFAIGRPEMLQPLSEKLGPWPVSGPALRIGTMALSDFEWAEQTRARLAQDANRLDALVTGAGARLVGGTSLFRLYEISDAESLRNQLARARIWTRTFPYSDNWIRLGLPGSEPAWSRTAGALGGQ